MNFPRISLVATGNRLKVLMEEKGITVRKLQEALGFANPQAIYKWRRGECLPTLDNLVVIALVLETTIDKIIVIDS